MPQPRRHSRWLASRSPAVEEIQLATLLSVHERIVGPEHPDALATRHRLAYWTAHAGDAARARDQFAALLPVRERVLGPEHPDTLAARTSLAQLTNGSGSRRFHRRRFRRVDITSDGGFDVRSRQYRIKFDAVGQDGNGWWMQIQPAPLAITRPDNLSCSGHQRVTFGASGAD